MKYQKIANGISIKICGELKINYLTASNNRSLIFEYLIRINVEFYNAWNACRICYISPVKRGLLFCLLKNPKPKPKESSKGVL